MGDEIGHGKPITVTGGSRVTVAGDRLTVTGGSSGILGKGSQCQTCG